MSEICPKCGLPKDLCVCEDIAKESQRLVVTLVKKKFGKLHTLIEGINPNEVDLKDVTKKLKSKFACGGTVKGSTIELQGDHTKNIREVLASLGFSPETIEVREGKR